MDRQRIGLLGGTFDPVHLGHLLLAVHSYDKLKLDRLIFIPTRLPPHKPKPRAQAGDRLKMLRLAVGEDSRFLVCDCELNRPEPSYTIDTIGQLQSSLGPDTDMFLLMGSDMLADLCTWKQVGQLVEVVSVVVVNRAGQHRPDFSCLGATLSQEQIGVIKANAVDLPAIEICSTEIRRRIAGGQSVRHFLPESVREYIAQHSLYR